MKRILALGLCLALLFPAAQAAGPEAEPLWTRTEPGGAYVTVRVPCPEGAGLDWGDRRMLCLRYADTKEPVPLTSDYQRGYLFATVPAEDADRPLEVFRGEERHFRDCTTIWQGHEYYDEPGGTQDMVLRGVVRGDQLGDLHPDAVLTRAESFALICRLLGLVDQEDEGELWAGWYYANGASTGYLDVEPSDWYFPVAATARTHGLTAEGDRFYPDRPVTRGEFTVMLARAMEQVGWLTIPEGTAEDLSLADAASIPDWALGAYLAFERQGMGGIYTYQDTEEILDDGAPAVESLAQWDEGATRGEVITFLDNARTLLPWYPYQEAIDWGFDEAMPILDGSTSTYPYTQAVYGALFSGYDTHPQFPAAHSTSHQSYERLIQGEADILFAATLPSEDLKAQAATAGLELECVPIAYDAMVFFTNAENSITGLTQKQIQDVYVHNKYTDWSQLGGPNAQLLPYRRNADSGSHALMERHFLEGGKLSLSPDVHNVLTSYAMSSALTDVAQALRTDPPAYAIGYSVYYYYLNNYWLLGDAGGGELKLLAVDGVVPSDATIADGSYPLADYNYAVIRSDEPEGSPARRMVELMLSELGQDCVGGAGFGPLSSGPQADFQWEFPDRELMKIFPAGTGYVALSWDQARTELRASGLERSGMDGRWHELTFNQCPAPPKDGLSAAVLGPLGHTVVFGAVGDAWHSSLTVRLSYSGGQAMTREVYLGEYFHFLLEGQPELERLELLCQGQVVASYEL